MKLALAVSLLTVCTAAMSTDCISLGDCPADDPFPVENTCRMPDVRFEQASRSFDESYVKGQGLHVHAQITGAVEVHVGSSDRVEVKVVPYAIGYSNKEAFARAQIDKFVSVTTAVHGNQIFIESNAPGATAVVGADISIAVPASFSGSFFVDGGLAGSPADTIRPLLTVDLTGTVVTSTTIRGGGSTVQLHGVGGTLDVSSVGGAVDMTLASWALSGGGSIDCDSIKLTVPSTANGVLRLRSVDDPGAIEVSGTPPDWQLTDDSQAPPIVRKTLTMGGATGAAVDVDCPSGIDIAVL